jgi:predicted SprT family Zn-dependent metalloprotease
MDNPENNTHVYCDCHQKHLELYQVKNIFSNDVFRCVECWIKHAEQ